MRRSRMGMGLLLMVGVVHMAQAVEGLPPPAAVAPAPGSPAPGVPGPHLGCPAACTTDPGCTVCVPTLEKKTKTRTCYRCEAKTICLPFCPRKEGHGCQTGCDEGGPCGKPRQVRVLFKRLVKEDHHEVKCVPQQPQPCIQGCPVQGNGPCPPPRTPDCLPGMLPPPCGPCDLIADRPQAGTLAPVIHTQPAGPALP